MGIVNRILNPAGGDAVIQAMAVDSYGITHWSAQATSRASAMAQADASVPGRYDVTVRSDRTSDGTVQGPGRGKLLAVRERGKWRTL
jgi:hypothetical protein